KAIVDAPDARELVTTRSEIRFENVRFHYGRTPAPGADEGREARVIDDLSLTIRPGERVGLVGRSGAGKS
ncbi:ATP-binding cassette domain-containing protein, partial [Campylobacter jejuni]